MTSDDWMNTVDIHRPSPARMYDYFLGGSHNFAADREAAEQIMAAIPNAAQIARANRAFLYRAVQYLVNAGIRQFLDIGSGIPTLGNVHEVAQHIDPHARVAYVDTDPIAVAHSVALLTDNYDAVAIQADLRYPAAILDHPGLRAIIDLHQPIALLLVSVLHFLPDEEAYPAVAHLRDALAPGSYLVISHAAQQGVSADWFDTAARVYRRTTTPSGTTRSHDQILRFLHGLPLVPPGLVWVSQWHTDQPQQDNDHPEDIVIQAAVGHKPRCGKEG